MLKDVSLGAMSIFTWLLAVLATAMLLPKDIEDRTLYTILAKPVPRSNTCSANSSACCCCSSSPSLLMSAVFVVVLYVASSRPLAEACSRGRPGRRRCRTTVQRRSSAAAFTISLSPASSSSTSRPRCCAALTLLHLDLCLVLDLHDHHFGRRSISSATSRGSRGTYWLAIANATGRSPRSSSALVALVFPDLQLFSLVDDIVAGNAIAVRALHEDGGARRASTSASTCWWPTSSSRARNYETGAACHAPSLHHCSLFGAAKMPFEARLDAGARAAYFHGAKLNLGLREQIGQIGFLAALSGFRSLVADFLWIQAHIAWERTEWGA